MTEEQRAARLRHHLYETCEGIGEHAERIVALEEVASGLLDVAVTLCDHTDCDECPVISSAIDKCPLHDLTRRSEELGIEV